MRKIAAVIAVALLVGVLAPSPTEASGRCRWAHGPVRIHVSGHFGHRWGVDRALRMWNHARAGQPHFVRTSARRAQVTVRVVHRHNNHSGMTTWWCGGGVMSRARVELNAGVVNGHRYRGYTPALRHETSLHELGHALGLNHNRLHYSVMSYRDPWWNGGRVYRADVRHLRSLY